MSLLPKAAFAALLLGTTVIAAPAFADDTGCPPGLHRANSEGGQNNGAARRADSEGGQNNAVRQADSEGGQNKARSAVPTPRAARTTARSARLTPRAGRTTRSAGPTPRVVRTTRFARLTPRAVRTTRSAAPTPRAARTTRSARLTPRAVRTTRSAAPTPRVVRTTTRSAAPRRSHLRARQRSRLASNRLALATAIPADRSRPAAPAAGRDFRCRPRSFRRQEPPRPIDSETQRAPLLPWTRTARNGRC